MARRLKPPDNQLNIVVPVLSETVLLKSCAEVYPHEFTGRDVSAPDKKGRYTVELYPITPSAPLRARDATEVIAYYFRREFGYDFPGYGADETQDNRDRIFLLVEGEEYWNEERYAVGAIVFRWRKYSNAPERLVLAWTWIHPFLRQTGIFTTYWNIFRELYGDFYVEPPYSPAMRSFLAKMNASLASKEEEKS
jgi:hypothetical protein